MKKNALLLAVGGMCLLAACSNDSDAVRDGMKDMSVQTISLQVASTGDNFLTSTRADRPLYSSAAGQDIESVKVIVYKKAAEADGSHSIVAVKHFTPWMNGGISIAYDNSKGHGREASWSLSGENLLPVGEYVALAVGYNKANYSTELATFEGYEKDNTFTSPFTVTGAAKEIFAGSCEFEIETGQKDFNTSLTLHRQVSGTFGYFTNIPTKGNADYAEKEGQTLRLVASAKNNSAVFSNFNSAFTTTGTATSTTNIQYVVNGFNDNNAPAADAKFYGSSVNDAFTVYSITLSDWFTKMDDGKQTEPSADGLLNKDDTWKNAIDESNADKMILKEGTVFGGSFLMPFALVDNKASFQLQLLDADGNAIRYWNIRLASTDPQIKAGKATIVAANGDTRDGNKETVANYSIVRNHLYGIGLRNAGDKPDPSEPTDPDPDKPQDLNNQNLILKVNDNWEFIHQMEID